MLQLNLNHHIIQGKKILIISIQHLLVKLLYFKIAFNNNINKLIMRIQNKMVIITPIIINHKSYKVKKHKVQLRNKDMEIF